jgi:hypothetical protein
MFKNIKYNENLEKVLTAILGFIGIVAIFVNLHLKGYIAENWLDAIKDMAGLAVVLAVFIASIRISYISRTFSDVARAKLVKLQIKFHDFLMGPQYNRENYDPELGKGLEYLFVTNDKKDSKKRAKFIPIQPLNEGVLVIHVQKGTLVHGLNYLSEQASDEEISKIQEEVRKAVVLLIEKKYKGCYEILPTSKKDTAIIIDFDENKMGKRKFSKAVEECVKCSIIKIQEFSKSKL